MECPHPVYIMYRVLTMAVAEAAAPAVPEDREEPLFFGERIPYAAPALKEII